MSAYTYEQLNDGTRIAGGRTWWGDAHYTDRVPLDEARRLLTVNVGQSPVYRETGDVEILELANGDVRIVPILHQIADKQAVYNADDGYDFQVAGKGWTLHDYNDWLLDETALLVETAAGQLNIRAAVALGHKQQAVVQIAPPEGITVGGDKILPYIAGFSSLDSSLATGWKATAVRIVCDNTTRASYNDSNKMYKVKHTRNSRLNVAKARQMIELFFEGFPELEREIERLMNADLPDNQFRMMLDRLYPVPTEEGRGKTIAENKRGQLHNLWNHDMRVAPFKGTAWGAVQAVNTATTHLFTVKGTAKGYTRQDRQMLNTIDGTIDQLDRDTISAINSVFADMGKALV